ncbi:NOT-MenG: RraA family [Rubrobacter radiotolerans]|uniref:4-hydroxy-4-methyl-2-oxoglutarate aldolase n=1 Tax=Rubrobacter radiotolerans TaxID=42256 RepID=A0A023X4X2_RUBRA|nr:ribonuclease E activity regulator RraA [Rubrobacter radiotolerans]AHY47398.1 NOT-MenG: RraA family [Rubrobacter radiotolerans]MDX5894801.1 ribonuclease E activity regulator RraA [Rubrobacter radiotolerans]SMC06789.1 regulator of ribonuclease activity A [Rubrobacter radiotolerans DSM 5868]
MTFHTADLSDGFPDKTRVPEPLFTNYGGRVRLSGPVATVRVRDDNVLVREALETVPEGTVVVVDGGGSKRCALVGGNLAKTAAERGLGGIVVNGCVRDAHELAALDLGVLALATHPKKSAKNGTGERDVPVLLGGVEIAPGEYLYADADGLLVSPERLL